MFDVMTESVLTTSPATSVAEASELMRRKSVHHLVVTEDRKIVGVLSERDIGGRGGAGGRVARTVGDVMTRHVVVRAPDDTVRATANLMRGRSIGCVPIVERGRLVGIVTVSDLLGLLGRGVDRRTQPARPPLNWRVAHRKRRGVAIAW